MQTTPPSSSKKFSPAIAVDAMGGDRAPEVAVKGTILALESDPELNVLLIGNEPVLRKDFVRLRILRELEKSGRLKIVHADETISMDDLGATAIRKKKGSSIHVGLELVSSGEAQAFLSAGNSGAVMAGALLILGRMGAIERPAILVRVPTAEKFVAILDAGANVDCRPEHLISFAEMGQIYAEVIEGMEKPRIGLLSNGAETHKGNELTRETHEALLKRTDIHYVGYVEGFDLFKSKADVIVCDGFVGNVALKLLEGLADTLFRWLRREIRRDIFSLMGLSLMRRLLRRFKAKFDYQPYGAAPLLGINGLVLISHGSSTEIAIRNGILTAKRAVEEDFTAKMAARLQEMNDSKGTA